MEKGKFNKSYTKQLKEITMINNPQFEMKNQNKTPELLEILSDNLLSKNNSISNFIDFDECMGEIENLKRV